MKLVRLRRANEGGEETGILFVNSDQVVAVNAGQHATEVHTADGRTQWVMDTPDEVVSLIASAS